MSTPAEPTKRFQCRHILTDGHRCGSPALKQKMFCYYHHTTRKPVLKTEAQQRKGRRAEFTLPRPEDRSAIQHSIGEVLLRIADHGIDPRRAGLLLYGLQIASLNLPRQATPAAPEEPAEMVEEIVEDPTHGPPLAPEAEIAEKEEYLSLAGQLLRELEASDGESALDEPRSLTASPGPEAAAPSRALSHLTVRSHCRAPTRRSFRARRPGPSRYARPTCGGAPRWPSAGCHISLLRPFPKPKKPSQEFRHFSAGDLIRERRVAFYLKGPGSRPNLVH